MQIYCDFGQMFTGSSWFVCPLYTVGYVPVLISFFFVFVFYNTYSTWKTIVLLKSIFNSLTEPDSTMSKLIKYNRCAVYLIYDNI